MIRNLYQFIQERFSLKVSLPLSFILLCAPLSMTPYTYPDLWQGVFTTFSVLLLLRIYDDISDKNSDKITHPRRGIVTGRINTLWLQHMCLIIWILVLIVNIRLYLFLFFITSTSYYALFFYYKKRIPILLQIPFLNLIFFLVPVYACLLGSGRIEPQSILLGLFTWFAAIAHDIAHSVHSRGENNSYVSDFSMAYGPRNSALIATGFFIIAICTGIIFSESLKSSFMFVLLLAATSIQVLYLCLKLVCKPTQSRAKAFYIYGFTFFLVPIAGLLIENLSIGIT